MECVLKKTSQFKASFKLARKRELDITLLENIVNKPMKDEPLEEKNHNHELVGDFKGIWECHIQPDWLLIYLIEDDVLTLTLVDTGTHSDLFNL